MRDSREKRAGGVVLVLTEHHLGRRDELSLQALALARGVAGEAPLEALLVGPGA